MLFSRNSLLLPVHWRRPGVLSAWASPWRAIVELEETGMRIHWTVLRRREKGLLRNPTLSLPSAMSSFSNAHRLYVKSLYRRFLTNELDWVVNRQEWRARAMNVRAEFERNRCAPRSWTKPALPSSPLGQKRSRPESFGYNLAKGRSLPRRTPSSRPLHSFVHPPPPLKLNFNFLFVLLSAPSMPDGTKWSVFSETSSTHGF